MHVPLQRVKELRVSHLSLSTIAINRSRFYFKNKERQGILSLPGVCPAFPLPSPPPPQAPYHWLPHSQAARPFLCLSSSFPKPISSRITFSTSVVYPINDILKKKIRKDLCSYYKSKAYSV